MMPVSNVDSSRTSALWRYGLFAIDSELLVERQIKINGESLTVGGHPILLDEFDRILVVGAGKAGTGMAKGVMKSLKRLNGSKQIEGWVNVPENCVEELSSIKLSSIKLHGGRPAGLNEPTEQGRAGAKKILELVQSAGPRDVVICLVSGGGSALAPFPVSGVSLEAKLQVTRFLSKQGASINELNSVRTAISQIKGGRLIQGFAGHSFHSLIISDVLGNPLEVIASGMTVPRQPAELESGITSALETLQKFDPDREHVDPAIYLAIENQSGQPLPDSTPDNIFNCIVGENATIVRAVEQMASQLGYEVFAHSASKSEADVEILADNLWNAMGQQLAKGPLARPFCFISGGEPTVNVAGGNGKGGRNQHLASLMLDKIQRAGMPSGVGFEFISIGTDGEDGPTDAAGAVVNRQVLENLEKSQLDLPAFIENRDSYHLFEAVGGLLKTGPTHTNVCDLRIFLVWDQASESTGSSFSPF